MFKENVNLDSLCENICRVKVSTYLLDLDRVVEDQVLDVKVPKLNVPKLLGGPLLIPNGLG